MRDGTQAQVRRCRTVTKHREKANSEKVKKEYAKKLSRDVSGSLYVSPLEECPVVMGGGVD
jgi:hypothetical protein